MVGGGYCSISELSKRVDVTSSKKLFWSGTSLIHIKANNAYFEENKLVAAHTVFFLHCVISTGSEESHRVNSVLYVIPQDKG